MLATLKDIPAFFLRPVAIIRSYNLNYLRPDMLAGLTVAIILLPQAIAYALIAELPPEMGLYTAVIGAIVAALWGSSNHVHTGPINPLSLLVLSVLISVATPGSREFIVAAGMVAVFAGLIQLMMGLARLGMLVNFVSYSVNVGFAAGAGVLIAVKELRHLFGLDFTSRGPAATVQTIFVLLPDAHIPSLLLGIGTILFILLLRNINRKLPATLIALILAAGAVFLLGLDDRGVQVIGRLTGTLPPLTPPPLTDWSTVARLSTGSLAVAAIGLIATVATARALAGQSGQRLDSNQEFVGQGLANIACGFFSGYPCSGSFSRSAVNFEAGGQTPIAAVFSALFVVIALFTLGPLAAFLPRAALAGVLILIAYRMIDRAEMGRILHGARADAAIMLVTFLGTVFLSIEFAVLAGILMSLGYYILKTSSPRVVSVVPDDDFKYLVPQATKPCCPQLGIIDILGDLYFGAVNHVEKAIYQHQERNPNQRFLLLRMHSVHHCDITGVRMLEGIARNYKERGGGLYLVEVRDPILRFMRATGFYKKLGAGHFLSKDDAIEHLFYKVLDPAICIYESDVRVFRECQNLPRPNYPVDLIVPTDVSATQVPTISALDLWRQLRGPDAPVVVDVREAREFERGHIPHSQSLPLSTFFLQTPELPPDRPLVFVCQGGRRSIRAACLCNDHYQNVRILEGGMLAWEAAGLLEAVGGREQQVAALARQA